MGRRSKKGAAQKTRVYVIQDKSGSMQVRQDATISGFNEYLATLKAEAYGEVFLTLTQFDTSVNEVYQERKLADVPELDYESYRPGGMTALLDAVGRTIRHAEQAGSPKDQVLLVIMTDGAENSSREWTKEAVADLIGKKSDDGWEVVYLGAGQDAWSGSSMLGIADTHTINYGTAGHAHEGAFKAVATSNVAYSTGLRSAAFDPQMKASLEKEAKEELVIPVRRRKVSA
jgi:hypothetical protein